MIGFTDIAKNIYNATIENRGTTMSVDGGTSPYQTGFMVGITGYNEIIPVGSFSPEDVRAFIKNARKALNAPNTFVGTWVWRGKVYLDVSIHVYNQEDAISLAKHYGQIAIFDLSTKREITV